MVHADTYLAPLVLTFLAAQLPLLGLWVVSLRLRDASLIDRFWGLGFVTVAWVAWLWSPSETARQLLLLALVTVWGVRLSVYLSWRNWGKGEDRRYAEMRQRAGSRFPLRSLFTVFLLQGLLLWIIALPLQAVMLADSSPFPVWLDVAGALLAVLGITFESLADLQMARFKRDPQSTGKVMDRGLWRYSRHPNYFGDALTWWGFFLISCATPYGIWTLPAPILMTWLLRRVSGVPLLEEDLLQRRPGYAEYIHRTPPFVPWLPKRN